MSEKTHDAKGQADVGIASDIQVVKDIDPAEEPQNDDTIADNHSRWQRLCDRLLWTPPNCRWSADNPPKFSMPLNILFAFAGAFTVANLYYNHPILNVLAHDFDVPYDKVSLIPTVAQVGYALGLFFLCPLGDLLKRRPFVLSLVLFTATLTIGLCLTQSFVAFCVIQAIIGFTTVTPQLMLPLVGDLAPPNKRAAALSVVVSGFVLGILVARLLSGIMATFVSWRYIYWLSVGLQYIIFLLLWAFMPDYPSTNKKLNYLKMLWSMLVMLVSHPVLLQASLVSFFISSTFTSFWTVLTFLLTGPPYHYDSVSVGLFALIGIATMFLTPLYGRYVIDRFVPWFSVILGMSWCLLGICLGAYTGTFTVAGPILQAWFLDLGVQTSQVANRSSIYALEPKARNRVNTVFMVFVFFGQLMGTSVGSQIYTRHGWAASQSFSVAAIGCAFLVNAARGPWENRWVGWRGGLSIFKKEKNSATGLAVETRNPLRRMSTNGTGKGGNETGDVEKAVVVTAGERDDGEFVEDGFAQVNMSKAVDMREEEEVESEKSQEDAIEKHEIASDVP